jgi:C-terminal processing protease CtpA/Prc
MTMLNVVLPVVAVSLLAGAVFAQSDDKEGLREADATEAEMDQKLLEAEQRLAEAARQIAEITGKRLPRMADIDRRFEISDKPRLGVAIDGERGPGPVEGVAVVGVTPGSAASDAGLRAGDVITAINGDSLSAESADVANRRLLDFMVGVEAGDVLKVEYLRDGKVGSVEVEPRAVERHMFVWQGDEGSHFSVPHAPAAPGLMERFRMEFGFPWTGTGLGDLELVELNEGLGRYFGTASGLLVVRAPKSDAFELEEGDVIQSIDGREPKDARHAMRILSSYQGGEKLKLGIMRDKKKRTLDIEIPVDQRGALFDGHEADMRPANAPVHRHVPKPPAPTTRT